MPRLIKKLLAAELKTSRPTLDGILARANAPRPDRARRYDLDEVRKFMAESKDASYEGEDIFRLKAKKVALECKRLQHEIDTRKGMYIAMSEVTPVIAAFNAELVANLRAKFEGELPPKYVGKNEIEAKQLNIEAIDFVIDRLKAGQWFNEKAPVHG